jgi:predicted RNase H-like HicB family nuclease
MKTHFVHCEWDDEAKVWFVAHSTVPGLATEAGDPAELLKKLRVLIAELLELNVGDGSPVQEVPVELLWQGQQRFTLQSA